MIYALGDLVWHTAKRIQRPAVVEGVMGNSIYRIKITKSSPPLARGTLVDAHGRELEPRNEKDTW